MKLYIGEEEVITRSSDLSGMTGIPPAYEGEAEVTLARFVDKKVLFTGDSITEANGRTTKNYHGYLHDWLGITVINDGKSGTGFKRAYGGYDGILTRSTSWNTKYAASVPFDAICLMGNMNDIGASINPEDYPLGSFGDSANTSHYGVLKLLMEQLITAYPSIPILFITSQPRSVYGFTNHIGWGIAGDFETYNNAIVEMCKHYSLPCLDLYHESGLRPWNATNNAAYFSTNGGADADGIHPNAAGHEIMALKIYEFLKQYL